MHIIGDGMIKIVGILKTLFDPRQIFLVLNDRRAANRCVGRASGLVDYINEPLT